jgi:hypothetical protein
MLYNKMIDVSSDLSPESAFVPYESLNDRQMAITGECFPEHLLIVCDSCYWSCTCFNTRGLVNICPVCLKEASKIPVTIDEISEISFYKHHGLTITFARKLPLR